MSSKPTKWLFDMNGIRVSFFVAGFIFTYVQIYFSGALTGGGDHPIAPAWICH